MQPTTRNRFGFTLVELLVVIAIIGMLIAIIIPAVQAAREAARRMQCNNHLKQLTLTVHSFHNVNDRFPASSYDPIVNAQKISRGGFMPLLLPFMELVHLYEAIMEIPAPGLEAWEVTINSRLAGNVALSELLCPSDGAGKSGFVFRTDGPISGHWYEAPTNYRGCRGDLAGTEAHYWILGHDHNGKQNIYVNVQANGNMHRSWLRPGEFQAGFSIVHAKGTSNTIAFSEGLIDNRSGGGPTGGTYKDMLASADFLCHFDGVPQNCLNLRGSGGSFNNPQQETYGAILGLRAWDHHPVASGFYALLPPNSPSCANDSLVHSSPIWISASSHHPGGVNVSFLDGSVRFVGDSIHVENLEKSVPELVHSFPDHYTPSAYPVDENGREFSYGLWAELGAVNSKKSPTLP